MSCILGLQDEQTSGFGVRDCLGMLFGSLHLIGLDRSLTLR